ncbi:MAG TPA: hypothetical protein VKG25_13590 [Bryobacteraceae bacterium]|nr:hypothetical protein [Bryobacteraceae bacterium]
MTLLAIFFPGSPSARDTASYAELAAAFLVFVAISVSAAGIGLGFGKKNQNFLWPEIRDAGSARMAARLAMWAAFCSSGITALTAFLAHNGVIVGDGPQMAVLRAILFGMLAIGIHRLSRSAAVLALLLFLIERTQNSGPIALTIILLVCFANGVRGTMAFHRY